MNEKYLKKIESRLYDILDDPKVTEYITLVTQRELLLKELRKEAEVSYACGVKTTSPLPGLSVEVLNRREYEFTQEFILKMVRLGHKAVKINVSDMTENELADCKDMLRSTKQSIKLTDKTAYTEKYKRKVKEVKLK